MNELTKKLMTFDEEQVAQIYKNVFDTEEGKLVFQDLKNRCFYNTSTADDNPHTTYWQEGMRNVVLHIETQINYEKKEEEDEHLESR